MRTLIACSILAAVIPLVAAAEQDDFPRPPRHSETGRFQYQGVAPVEGATSSELYSRAKAWVATAYRSAKDVIQLDDPNAAKLIVRGNFHVAVYTNDAWIRHTLTVEVKDGRFRYTLTDFVFDNGYWSVPLEEEKKFTGQRKKLFGQVIAQAEATIVDMKKSMSSSSEKDEW